MEYRLLGLSGCAVSALALGSLTFGNETGEADSFAQLDRFTAAGGTLIDTADVYADGRSEGMRIWNERGHLERNWQVIDAVREVAAGRGASMSQVAIAWVLGRPAVRSVILGARTVAQLEDNLAAAELSLDQDETRRLEAASDPGAPDYPYGERGQTHRNRRISGGRF
jgi:aryl-alcohol dehydrogenase-like predicted oxidoreductase